MYFGFNHWKRIQVLLRTVLCLVVPTQKQFWNYFSRRPVRPFKQIKCIVYTFILTTRIHIDSVQEQQRRPVDWHFPRRHGFWSFRKEHFVYSIVYFKTQESSSNVHQCYNDGNKSLVIGVFFFILFFNKLIYIYVEYPILQSTEKRMNNEFESFSSDIIITFLKNF